CGTAPDPGRPSPCPPRASLSASPPLPLLVMLLPRLFVDSLPAYRLAFGILAAALALLACWMGVRLAERRAGDAMPPARLWTQAALFVLAIGPLIVSRFDVLPAMLVVAALLLLERERPMAAGLCVGGGALAKLYPVLLLLVLAAPLLAEGQRRAFWRLTTGFAVAVLVLAAPFLILAPGPFLRSTFVYGARPFQVESSVGVVALLIGGRDAIFGSYGSYNVVTASWLESAWSVVLPTAVLACAGLAARQAWRRPSPSSDERA